MASETPGHAFISYVREDAAEVDRIERILKAANIPVWRDTADLWPGEDWRRRIKQAITDGALVFIACFSEQSAAKSKSYQREELILAIDEYRVRNPEAAWLIPVRISDCEIPDYSLGAGRTLRSLQLTDLFGDRREEGSARLVAAVLRALGRSESSPSTGGLLDERPPDVRVKQALLDPARQIELDDFVSQSANAAATILLDQEIFPTTSANLDNGIDGIRFVASQADRYWTVVDPLMRVMIAGSAWGQPQHDAIWTRAIERVANTDQPRSGQTILLSLRRFPTLPLLYASALASMSRNNFGPLRAVAVDAQLRRDGQAVPLVADAHIYGPFQNGDVVPDVLALEAAGEEVGDDVIAALRSGRKGRRHTPVSDLLHDRLRPLLGDLIPDDDEFSLTFDRVEVLLGALAADMEMQLEPRNIYVHGAWFGRFTWHDRRTSPRLEQRMLEELRQAGTRWPPLAGGLFGGSNERAEAAFTIFAEGAAHARRNNF